MGAFVRTYPGERDADYEHEADRDDRIDVYVNPDFPGRADDLREGLYEGERLRCDWKTPGDRPGHVGASYGGHNRFREVLCMAAHGVMPEQLWSEIEAGIRPDTGPFVSLIHFADNEGVLGPETTAALLADFDAHADTVRPKMGEWAEHYDHWRTMLRIAVDAGGFLDFR